MKSGCFFFYFLPGSNCSNRDVTLLGTVYIVIHFMPTRTAAPQQKLHHCLNYNISNTYNAVHRSDQRMVAINVLLLKYWRPMARIHIGTITHFSGLCIVLLEARCRKCATTYKTTRLVENFIVIGCSYYQ